MRLKTIAEKNIPVKPKSIGLDSRVGGNDGGIFIPEKTLNLMKSRSLKYLPYESPSGLSPVSQKLLVP